MKLNTDLSTSIHDMIYMMNLQNKCMNKCPMKVKDKEGEILLCLPMKSSLIDVSKSSHNNIQK